MAKDLREDCFIRGMEGITLLFSYIIYFLIVVISKFSAVSKNPFVHPALQRLRIIKCLISLFSSDIQLNLNYCLIFALFNDNLVLPTILSELEVSAHFPVRQKVTFAIINYINIHLEM